MGNIRVGVIQMDVGIGERESNIKRAVRYIDELSQRDIDFILLPELWTTGYAENIHDLAEELDGELFKSLIEIAKANDIYIMGSVPLMREDKLYNAMHIIGPEGLIGLYAKIHLIRLMGEDKIFEPGDKLGLYNVKGINTGTMICYDLRFPELARSLALRGAEIIFLCAEWPSERLSHWRYLNIARAVENEIYIVACNRVGSDKYTFGGHSMVVSPIGEVILEAEDKEVILEASLDMTKISRMRSILPVLEERRPDLYKL